MLGERFRKLDEFIIGVWRMRLDESIITSLHLPVLFSNLIRIRITQNQNRRLRFIFDRPFYDIFMTLLFLGFIRLTATHA